MGRILFSIVSLVAFAVIVVMNTGTETSFNLFGWEFEDVPVVVIAIISFVLGALYSFVYYLVSYFSRSRKAKLSMQKERLKSQDASLKAREKRVKTGQGPEGDQQRQLPPAGTSAAGREPFSARPADGGVESDPGQGTGPGPSRRRGTSGGWLGNLFGKKNSGQ